MGAKRRMKMSAFNDVLLVGIDVENAGDVPVLIIGRRQQENQ